MKTRSTSSAIPRKSVSRRQLSSDSVEVRTGPLVASSQDVADAFIKALAEGAPRTLAPGDLTKDMIFEKFREHGIQIGDSTFWRRIRKLINDGVVEEYLTIIQRDGRRIQVTAYHFNSDAWSTFRQKK